MLDKNQFDIDAYRGDILYPMLTSQDLLLILAIAEEGTVSAAAERLTTSQPALSRTLGDLERRLGTKLFDRHSRGMTATPVGEALAGHGRAVLAVNHRAQRELDIRLVTSATELLLGVVPQLSVVPIARALAALEHADPALRVHARIGAQEDLLPDLRRGDLDVVIGPSGLDLDFVSTPLFEERPVLVVRRTHPLTSCGGDDLEALASYPWITPPAGDPAVARVAALFRDAGMDAPIPAITTLDIPLTANVALESDFIAVLPHDVALFAVGVGRAAILPVTLPGPRTFISALQRRDLPQRPEVAALLDALTKELRRAGIQPAA